MPRYHHVADGTADGKLVAFTPSEEAAADVAEAAATLTAALLQFSGKRDRVLVAGVTHAGHRWHADATSQHAMASAVVLGQAYEAATSQSWSTTWKTLDGFISVTLPELITAGLVVGGFVQAAFVREAALAAQARGGDVAGALAAAESGWPT